MPDPDFEIRGGWRSSRPLDKEGEAGGGGGGGGGGGEAVLQK